MYKITQSKLETVEKLLQDIQDAADRAIKLYYNLATEKGIRYHSWNRAGIVTTVNSDSVELEWDEYARGCRVDNGSFTIPAEALDDETYVAFIEKKVADEFASQEKEKEESKARELRYKQVQLQKLKEELGEI